MSFLAAIEIICSSGGLPIKTIEEAYQFSSSGTVLLIMNEVTARQINLALDRIVPTLPLTIPGVLYVNISDCEKTRGAFEMAPVICPTSRLCRHLAIANGHQRKLIDYTDFANLMSTPATAELGRYKQRVADIIGGAGELDTGQPRKLWRASPATGLQYPSNDRSR